MAVPTQSALAPAATVKISHARIIKTHRTPDQAGQFHNALAGEV